MNKKIEIDASRFRHLLKIERCAIKLRETGGVYESTTMPAIGDYGVDQKAFAELLQALQGD